MTTKRSALRARPACCAALCSLLLATGGACRALAPTPPGQPRTGPGGAAYPHGAATAERFGEGGQAYWLFLPDDPQPAEAPFVVFLHGWAAVNPQIYGAWIQHTVRKGHIVVFPRYQADLFTPAEEMTPNALAAVQDAWDRLTTQGPVQPITTGTAWVGHSAGGFIATNLAAMAEAEGFPTPVALMAVQPGGGERIPLVDTSQVPASTLVLVLAGDADDIVGSEGAETITAALDHIPDENIDQITVRSERRTFPQLIADHLSPLAVHRTFLADVNEPLNGEPSGTGPFGDYFRDRLRDRLADRFAPNAIDYFGYWKLLDALLDAAYKGENREYALGNTDQQRFMGQLSTGVPMTSLLIEPAP